MNELSALSCGCPRDPRVGRSTLTFRSPWCSLDHSVKSATDTIDLAVFSCKDDKWRRASDRSAPSVRGLALKGLAASIRTFLSNDLFRFWIFSSAGILEAGPSGFPSRHFLCRRSSTSCGFFPYSNDVSISSKKRPGMTGAAEATC